MSSNSPKYLLYAFKGFDNRYPLFDEPGVLEAILGYYSPVKVDEKFLVLSSDNCQKPIHKTLFRQDTISFDTAYCLPQYTDKLIWVKTDVQLSLFGKVIAILYKSPTLDIEIGTGRNFEKVFRFIPGVASQGLFASQYVRGIHEVQDLLEGNYFDSRRIRTLEISIHDQCLYKKWCFKDEIGVTLLESDHPVTWRIAPEY